MSRRLMIFTAAVLLSILAVPSASMASTSSTISGYWTSPVVKVGHTDTFHGKASPADVGGTVVLQRYSNSTASWVKTASTKLNSYSKYSFKVAFSTSGGRKYRAVKL